MKLVIDTNVFISALIKKDGLTRDIIINSGNTFLFPEYEFQEIYKYKNEILKKSRCSEKEFIRLTTSLLNHMRIVRHGEICNYYYEASEIMRKIDPDDKIFIATALAFNAYIWSDDEHFKRQSRIRVLTTKEMIELCK